MKSFKHLFGENVAHRLSTRSLRSMMSFRNPTAHNEALTFSPKPNLLNLPLELTDEIFKYILPHCKVVHMISYGNTGYERSYFICTSASHRAILCPKPFLKCMHASFTKDGGQVYPSIDMALLFTCRELYTRSAGFLYSQNAFEFGVLPTDRNEGFVGVLECAGRFLRNLGPNTSRQWLRHIHVDYLEPDVLNRIPWNEGQLRWWVRFQRAAEELSSLVAGMKLLRLSLGVGMGPCSTAYKEDVDDVLWLQPLFALCAVDLFRTEILVRAADDGNLGRGTRALFLPRLVEAMRMRRLTNGIEGVVRYVEDVAAMQQDNIWA